MKRILFIGGTILLIIVIGVGIWFLFFRGNNSPIQNPFQKNVDLGTFFDVENNNNNNNFNGNYDKLEPSDFTREARLPILRQLSAEPVSGYTFFTKEFNVLSDKNSTSTEPEPGSEMVDKYVFRFMERATGHIFETVEDNLTVSEITNTTIQKNKKTIFSADGTKVLITKVNDLGEGIDSFLGKIVTEQIEDATTTDETVEPKTVLDLQPYSIISSLFSLSPNQNDFSYLVSSQSSASIFVNNFDSSKEKEIINIPLKDVLLDWNSDNLIMITTKPSSGEPGYAYLLNTKTGNFEKALGAISGLTTNLSPDGKKILFSSSKDTFTTLYILNTEENSQRKLSLSTLPEKCVFAKADKNIIYCAAQNRKAPGQMPDDWYKGKIFFDDFVWKINIDTGSTKLFYSFDKEKYGQFDVVDMKITPDDKYLTFVNKIDLTLWSLNLEELNSNGGFTPDSGEGF